MKTSRWFPACCLLLGAATILAAESLRPQPPLITKKGTLGLDLCETTPNDGNE